MTEGGRVPCRALGAGHPPAGEGRLAGYTHDAGMLGCGGAGHKPVFT
jgi:hypothetical protein